MKSLILLTTIIMSFWNIASAVDDEDCFELRQKLKALHFNTKSSEEKIRSIRQQLLELEGNEKSLMDQLSSAEHDLLEAETESRRLHNEGTRLKERLLTKEHSVEGTNANLTTLTDIYQQSTSRVRSLKESTETLASVQNLAQERARKYELKLNMLRTDVEASVKTLNDTRDALSKRITQEAKLHATAVNATQKMLLSADEVSGLRSEEGIVVTQIERLHREIADETALLDSKSTQEESRKAILAESRQKLDNTRAELQSLRHSYKVYVEGTIAQLCHEIDDLKSKGDQLLEIVGKSTSSEERHNATMFRIVNSSLATDPSRMNLRDFVRQSRMFLSQHGYRNRISLVQKHSAEDFDEDVVDFRKKSSELATLRELSEIDEGLNDANSRLNMGLKHLKELHDDFRRAQNDSDHDIAIIQTINASVLAITSDVSRIRGVLTLDQDRLRNEISSREVLRKQLLASEAKLRESAEFSMHTNHSFTDASVRSRAAKSDVLIHETALQDLKKAVDVTRFAADTMTEDANEAERLLKDVLTTLTRLQNNTEDLSKSMDDAQRIYMEGMADASELTRRLDELVRRIGDSESSRERVLLEIGSLKTQVRASLSRREGLTQALGVEIRVHNDFIEKTSSLETHLDAQVCTT